MSANYSCGNCQLATARYEAVGNKPAHAHLCTLCWEQDKNREHFKRIEPKNESSHHDLNPLVEGMDYVSAYPKEIYEGPMKFIGNNSLYGKHRGIEKVEPGFLPMSLEQGRTVPAGEQYIITSQPYCEMKLTRLIVPRSIAIHFNLRGLQLTNQQKLAGPGEVSCEIFWGDDERPDIPPILFDYRLSPMHRVALTVFNHSAMAQTFNATFLAELIHQ